MSEAEKEHYELLRRIFQDDAREFLIGRRRLAGDEAERWASTWMISDYILTKHQMGDIRPELFSVKYTQHFLKDLQKKGELVGLTKEEALEKDKFPSNYWILDSLNDWNKLYKFKKNLDTRK